MFIDNLSNIECLILSLGIFTNKGTKDRNSQGATSQIKCSNTLWLLTTNKFDEDIHAFNDKNIDVIKAYTAGKVQFTDLHDSFDGFIRPKLRSYFKGGLTRRIDAVVPFFKFSEEEAYVIADMYVDRVREMYAKPSNSGTFTVPYFFLVYLHSTVRAAFCSAYPVQQVSLLFSLLFSSCHVL
jgi:ATP-dependent Clp protease ATP-binding subunit ClpA